MKMKRKTLIATVQAIVFLLPAIVILVVFIYGPLMTSIGYAFTKFENFKPIGYVGFQNFLEAFQKQQFWNSLRLTFNWVILNTILPTIIGMVLALLIEFFTRGRWFANFSRTVLFIPMMMSYVAVGILWAQVYDANIGLIAGLVQSLGITQKVNALGNASWAIVVAFVPVIWKEAGFSMVIFSAAAQGISEDIIEASIVEGASKMQQIRHIMIPSMMGPFITVLLINMISGFKAFDLLYTLTRGGPGAATNVMAVYAYEQAFSSFRFDYASTLMTLQLIVCITLISVFTLLVQPIRRKFDL